jgi:ankyrin repeat protein
VIQESTSLSLAEDELSDGESDGELKARRVWSICEIKNRANKHLFEEADLKLSARKSQAAKDLIVAIHQNNIEEIDRLIAANPKLPFYCNAKRYFPLQYAAVKNPDVIRKLVKAGVPVEHSYDGMLTPLQLAVIYGKVEAVKELISLGANPDVRIYAGESLRPSTQGDADATQLARKLSAGRQPNGVGVLHALL